MKVHIHQDHDNVLSGYYNICASETEALELEIDATVEDAEATEIILNNTLEFLPQAEIVVILNQLVRKLRHGGVIILTGTDAYAVAKKYANYKMSIEEYNVLTHGPQDGSQVKKTTLTIHGLVNFLTKQFGLQIVNQGLEEYTYSIEARRP